MTDVRDEVVARALGEELRRARENIGWSRDELAGRMTTEIQPRTIASYEQGARHCTVVRLAEICRTLRISAPELMGLALQHAEIDLETISLQVDLHALSRDDSAELEPLRTWANRRLAAEPTSRIATLKLDVIQEMAILFDYTRAQLVRYLTRFTPPTIAAS